MSKLAIQFIGWVIAYLACMLVSFGISARFEEINPPNPKFLFWSWGLLTFVLAITLINFGSDHTIDEDGEEGEGEEDNEKDPVSYDSFAEFESNVDCRLAE